MVKTIKQVLLTGAFIIVLSIIFIGINRLIQTKQVDASVARFAEYQATTTRTAITGVALTNYTVLGANPLTTGSSVTLGSIVITGANTGIINIYDGTTTGPHSDSATTSLAIFPASTAAGTYTFDVTATKGILIELQSGLMPTTTITWRQN